jgi:hypothetical protein
MNKVIIYFSGKKNNYYINFIINMAIYYVSNSGSDNNDGSSGSPFKTLTKALTEATDTDTVNISGTVDSNPSNFYASLPKSYPPTTLSSNSENLSGNNHGNGYSILL